VLHGDSDAERGWFWAIGSASPWEGGIPSFKEPRGGMATKHVRLAALIETPEGPGAEP
jgi:hypothetical protein